MFSNFGVHLRTIGRKGAGTCQFNRPCGVVSDKNNNIIVVDKNCRVQVFTETGEFIHSFGSNGRDNGQLMNPVGLSLDTDENIIVTDRGDDRVKVFNMNGIWLKSFDCGGQPVYCVVHGDCYYVSSYSDDCIKVFDKSGTFLCEYCAGASLGPSGLAVDKAGNLIVCDSFKDRVLVLQVDGTLVYSFSVGWFRFGVFYNPFFVAVMKDGEIVVCNKTSIQVFREGFERLF